MEKIKLDLYVPKAPVTSVRVRRQLEDILHMELSLSIARGVLTALDKFIGTFFTVDINWRGYNVLLYIRSDQRTVIRDFLKSYPNCLVDTSYLIIGQRGEPCVIVFVSRIDTDPEVGK